MRFRLLTAATAASSTRGAINSPAANCAEFRVSASVAASQQASAPAK